MTVHQTTESRSATTEAKLLHQLSTLFAQVLRPPKRIREQVHGTIQLAFEFQLGPSNLGSLGVGVHVDSPMGREVRDSLPLEGRGITKVDMVDRVGSQLEPQRLELSHVTPTHPT